MLTFQILIVDDEPLVRSSLTRLLQRKTWRISTAASGKEAKKLLSAETFDLAIVDYKLGDTDGLEMIEYIKEHAPLTTVVMLTAYGNVNLAVEAIKKGAYDFLQKEGDPKLTLHVVERALENVRLRKEVELLRAARVRDGLHTNIIAESQQMRALLKTVDEFAKTDATVLIEGETGTGKSLIAEYMHYSGPRHHGPFVTINCGAIPRELIESELFGYEQGAFTGAKSQGKLGLIKRADGGTLFLDEIGDLSMELQSKLLYVLEKSEFLSIGAVEPTTVDVRFIAATNVAIEERIINKEFRRDLYYRLNVANVKIPPLRERKEDVLPFAKHFVQIMNQKFNKSILGISPDGCDLLQAYPWPGNVRELRNVIERVSLLKTGDTITKSDLAFVDGHLRNHFDSDTCHIEVKFKTSANVLNDATKQVILCAWEVSGHNQTRAATLLGLPRTTLQTHLQKYGLI